VRTSLSTLKAAYELRTDLLNHQRTFFQDAIQEASKSRIKAYVFGDPSDPVRTHQFVNILKQHQIRVHELARPLSASGQSFAPGSAYVIPTQQRQYRLLTALFERRTSFQDSLFYDVSAWTLPLAFNMPFAELTSSSQEVIGDILADSQAPKGRLIGNPSAYAYAFEWKGYRTPRALYRLQSAGVLAKVATQPFRITTAEGTRIFDYGTILIPMGIQKVDPSNIRQLVNTMTQEDGIDVYAFDTGLSTSGISLGSPNFAPLQKPEIAILVGSSTSAYNAGEAWHLLDQQYDMDVSLIETQSISPSLLNRYTTIIMAGGSYSALDSTKRSELKEWTRAGNTLITYDSAANWAVRNKFINASYVSSGPVNSQSQKPYINAANDRGAQVIGGAIFQVQIDRTHPLVYGYENSTLPVFRRGTTFLEPARNPYATPLIYTQRPLLAGYISGQNLSRLRNSASAIAGRQGSGRVILMTDNPTFRAYFYGTQKLLANAIFFGPTISSRTLQNEE